MYHGISLPLHHQNHRQAHKRMHKVKWEGKDKKKNEISQMLRRIILVKKGEQQKLAEDCKVHRNTVRNALLGISESEQAMMIRKRAKEAPYYGVEVRR